MIPGIVASQPRLVAPPAASTLLDQFPNAFLAFSSARKLRSAYDGPCMQVRRVADSALLDIGFDANGNLDTAALLSFAGAGTVTIRRWYDQATSYADNIASNRYLQNESNVSRQPSIVVDGSLQLLAGKPAAKFSGAQGVFCQATRATQPAVYSRTVLCAFRSQSANAIGVLYETGGANGGTFYSEPAGVLLDVNELASGEIILAGTGKTNSYTAVRSSNTAATLGKDTVFVGVFDQEGTNHATEFPEFRVDGISGFSGTGALGLTGVTPGRFAETQYSVGSRSANSPSLPFVGLIAELVVFEGRSYGGDQNLDGNLLGYYS